MAEPRLTTEPREGGVVVSVHGELDVVTSQELDDCLAQARRGGGLVVLDLSAADFMDTTALAVIVGHWRRAGADGVTFRLAGARYRYLKALWITGLADRLPLYEDVAQAFAAGRPAANA